MDSAKDDVPRLYDGLDEVTAPPPLQQNQMNPRENLEQRNHDPQHRADLGASSAREDKSNKDSEDEVPEEYIGLDELVAPAPSNQPDEQGWYRRDSLEDRRLSQQRRDEEETTDSSPVEPKKPAAISKPLLTQLHTISHLIFFSILGTLARLGTQWLSAYPNAPLIASEIWANFGGCVVIGFLQEDRALFAPKRGQQQQQQQQQHHDAAAHLKHKKTIPLYIGLSVGFCGSYTSFSSMMRDIFLALSNDLVPPAAPLLPRHRGWSVNATLAAVLSEVSLAFTGFYLGAHLAIALASSSSSSDRLSRLARFDFSRTLNFLSVPIAFGSWLGAVLLAIFPPHDYWRGDVVVALVFAPVGCLLRFYLSLVLNPRKASFPLGTFAANIFGTAVLAMCFDLQHGRIGGPAGVTGGGTAGCQVLQGIMDGFCGCLTTVSTWVSELKGLRKRHGYLYGGISVGVGLGLMVVIVGPVKWMGMVHAVSCKAF